MAKELVVNQIYKLSQEEGLTDTEIAKKLGYARGSIQRIRMENNIPTANKSNRKDKICKCMKCDGKFFIRRCESNRIVCPTCEIMIENQNKEE